MKITYLANARIPTEKAHGIQITKMCETFAKAGNEVKLILPRRINPVKMDVFEYYNLQKNFKIIKIPILDLVPIGKIGTYLTILQFVKSSFLYVIFHKQNIVYSRDAELLFFPALFGYKNLAWEVHGIKKNFVNKFVLKRAKVIAITQGIKDDLILMGGEESNIIVQHDGVDLEDFELNKTQNELREELNLPKDKKIVSYIGKFTGWGEEKGIDEMVQSFSGVLKESKKVFFIIVGANKSEINHVHDIANKYSIYKPNFLVVEHQNRKEVIKYMLASDILIMNYTNTLQHRKYTSPMKLFEYMASKKPITAPAMQCIKEVVDKSSAYLFEPDNINNMGEKIKEVLANENLAKQKAEKAFETVKDYTWRKRVNKVVYFIK